MKTIPLTKGKFALVDDEDFELVSSFRWCAHAPQKTTYYANRRPTKEYPFKAMHRLIMNITDPRVEIDHIDGNGLNNQKSNLRIVTGSQNRMNRVKQRTSNNPYKGTTYVKAEGTWMARITANGVTHYLGHFDSPEKAALAFNAAALKYHGEFARLNEVVDVSNGTVDVQPGDEGRNDF